MIPPIYALIKNSQNRALVLWLISGESVGQKFWKLVSWVYTPWTTTTIRRWRRQQQGTLVLWKRERERETCSMYNSKDEVTSLILEQLTLCAHYNIFFTCPRLRGKLWRLYLILSRVADYYYCLLLHHHHTAKTWSLNLESYHCYLPDGQQVFIKSWQFARDLLLKQ